MSGPAEREPGSNPMLDRIRTLHDECRWRECIAACADAIAAERSEVGIDDWYMVRSILASAAVQLEGTPEFREAVEAAIRGMEQIVSSHKLPRLDERRGLAFRTLGYLYSERSEGEAFENYRRSIEYYESAVSILRPDQAGQEWAETTLSLGTQLLERARMLTRDEIARNAHEMESARQSVNASISAFERALAVYTEESYPDERETTVELIGAAHEILDILNRQQRSLH